MSERYEYFETKEYGFRRVWLVPEDKRKEERVVRLNHSYNNGFTTYIPLVDGKFLVRSVDFDTKVIVEETKCIKCLDDRVARLLRGVEFQLELVSVE